MKKILFCILLCFYITGVQALEYSGYSEFSDYTDKVIENDDLTDVKVERRYQFYKLNKVTGPYLREDETRADYPYLDKDNFVYSEYSEYSLEEPLEVPSREIESKMINHYKAAGPIDYITLTAINGDIYLDNFIFLYKGEYVDYEITELGNELPFIKRGDTVGFKLQRKIGLADLEIKVKGLGLSSDNYSFEFSLGSDSKTYQKISSSIPGNSGAVLYCNAFRPLGYDDYYSFENFEPSKFISFVDKVNVYRYRDIMYQSYKMEKEYYPEYLVNGTGEYIYKDEIKYKDYYAKRTRSIINKIDFNDKLLSNSETYEPKVSNLVSILEDRAIESEVIDNYDSSYKVLNSPLKSEKIAEEKVPIWYFIGPFLIVFGIIILVLSKLYKRKK